MMDGRKLTLAITFAILAMIFCASAQAQQASSTEDKSEEPKTGAISGTVVNEHGQPVAGAGVFIRAIGATGPGRTTTTDSEGSFQVTGLDRAAYSVSAAISAYTTAPRDPDNTQATYYRVGDSVKLELIKGGVITGTVTNSSGEPIVAVRVRAFMIRDGNDKPLPYGGSSRERTTDDRGVYRIYGLAPGTYIVSAGGGGNFAGSVDAYDNDAPTYSPSSTRDNAAEISVRAGEENASVDIRYRGEPGHVVSGTASGPEGLASPSGFSINLSSIANGAAQSTNSFQRPDSRGFAFYGVADGDYEVIARASLPGGESTVSEPRRIKVRGADVTGIELSTKPLASISGRVVLQEAKAPECKGKRKPLFAETLVTTWRSEKDQPNRLQSVGALTAPDKQGEFTLRNLAPGQHDFSARFFAKYWYLQSITLQPGATPAAKLTAANRTVDAARNWITLKPGERMSGLTITLAEGAASLHGTLKLAEGEKVPAKLYLHLVPAEKEKADDVLRFFATPVNRDGTFSIGNLPPGRYWAITRVAAETESQLTSRLRLPEEGETRKKLRADSEAAKLEIEFKPCQNVVDYQVPLKP
jgi:Carboxypeptidase regulatory-like domain